jgi:hypothetical protein
VVTALAIIIALQCCWTWAYRGGSDGFGIPDLPVLNRLVDVLLTPLMIFGAINIMVPVTSWSPLTWWGGESGHVLDLFLAIALFAAASTDGWGRQMDMTSAGKPDDETGYKMRDLLFDAKSSFLRDLVGLVMRFAQFAGSALAAYFFWAPAAIIPASMIIVVPALWVVERFWFRGPNKPSFRLPWLKDGQYMAWVEWFVGCYLAAATITVILVWG